MSTTHPYDALIVAVEIVAFWHESLMDICAQRREIIEDKEMNDTRRGFLLGVNTQVRKAIRIRLSEAQHDHSELVRESANRIAKATAFFLEQGVSANDDVWDQKLGDVK